jgi:hypothetical protein
MSELFGYGTQPTHQDTARNDEVPMRDNDDGFDTDVEGVRANAQYGPHNLPVFDVEPETFYQNSEFGRKRMRFPTDSGPQKYMQGSRYSRPFYIRTTNKDGKQYIKRVK